jgi:hypothetical protein
VFLRAIRDVDFPIRFGGHVKTMCAQVVGDVHFVLLIQELAFGRVVVVWLFGAKDDGGFQLFQAGVNIINRHDCQDVWVRLHCSYHAQNADGPLVSHQWIDVLRFWKNSDGWIRHKLRALLWRQWKRNYTRAKNLIGTGLGEARAWQSATNGHGPWWNGGAAHMHEAFPKSWFDRLGLVSLLDTQRRFSLVS